MRLGMTLPTMTGALDRDGLLAWSTAIDRGPWSTLAVGERITFPNAEAMVTLSAAAAVTSRVDVAFTLVVLPLHSTVLVAKQLATLDVVSGGRLVVAIGSGGRDEDYRAVGAPIDRKLASLAARVEGLRRTWRGEPPLAGAAPVGPAPVRPGGPPLLAGVLMPKALRAAAAWADGVCGFSFGPSADEIGMAFDAARRAWADAGRPAPRLVTSCWFALGPDARARMDGYVRRYLGTFGEDTAASMAAMCQAVTPQALRDAVRRIADTGADELLLVPTTADVAELDRIADALA